MMSECLDYILTVKDKKKLRSYEDKKFVELRTKLISDDGLPSLLTETETIVRKSQKASLAFANMPFDNKDDLGLQI